MGLVKGIILLLELGKARPLVGGLLMVAAGLGGDELLLGRAEVLHDGIAGADHLEGPPSADFLRECRASGGPGRRGGAWRGYGCCRAPCC